MAYCLEKVPTTEDTIFVNSREFADEKSYELKVESFLADRGCTESMGGGLPDDNVRLYVPLDINEDEIMQSVYSLYCMLGSPTEYNEMQYFSGMNKVLAKLELYDQLHCRHNFDQVSLNTETGEMHCRSAAVLAKKIKCLLLEDEGCAEMYPYEIIEKLDQIYQSLY